MLPRAEDLHKKAQEKRQEEFERIQKLADNVVNSVALQKKMEDAANEGRYGITYSIPDFYRDALGVIKQKLIEKNFDVSHRDRYSLFISWADARGDKNETESNT